MPEVVAVLLMELLELEGLEAAAVADWQMALRELQIQAGEAVAAQQVEIKTAAQAAPA